MQGILEECEEQAIKQILADQIKAAMEKDRLTKAAMAVRMQTSRRALDRLFDPANTSVTLHTLQRARFSGRPPTPVLNWSENFPVEFQRLQPQSSVASCQPKTFVPGVIPR